MKKFITSIFTGVALLFAACDEAPKFTIKGSISEADGKSIYLSHVGIDKSTLIDSAKIKSDGKFEFRSTQPQSYDFYRLQLDKKGRAITVAVDSTECITLTINGKNFDISKITSVENASRGLRGEPQDSGDCRTA